ncbi:FtsX-like permease family protein [Massilia sp. YIM B02443]|uniref:FtsX-like permease family protein n=1 Tax=Massilia sp. YIM B02443 TaxID=3050127 RepID=UPI0025B6C5B2|nr:FtsX-like permease family protein [Massilia sp. YIM B02443]MDN4037718.1 ABC transporter permease [Massilia sp. YIM B02443]
MRPDDFRIGLRHLVRQPGYSAIAILGLSVAFAACLLLLGYVQYSWRYDAHVPRVEQIYVVKQRFNVDPVAPWFDQAPLLLRATALKTPGVVDATAFFRADVPTVKVGSTLHKMPSLLVLPRFAEVLGLRALEGDLDAALNRPEGLVLTLTTAQRLFGTPRALGRTVQIGDKALRVAAIVPDTPANTTIPFEALYGVNSVLNDPVMRSELQTGERGAWGRLLLRIDNPDAVPQVAAALQRTLDTAPAVQGVPPDVRARLGGRRVMDLALSPLREAYFDRDVARNPVSPPGDRGDRATVTGLALVALLILAIGAINYVNLATVRVLRRQREIGMRKVLGASARQIVLQFLAESLLVALLATVLGLLLAWLALPLFAELVNRKLEHLFAPANVAAALLIGVVLGLVAGLQPAWTALRVRPAQALAGRANTESRAGARLRKALTVLQIATAVGLASLAMAIALQTRFAVNASPGFDAAPLLIVDLPQRGKKNEAVRGFMAELGQQPGVHSLVLSEHVVGRTGNGLIQDIKRDGGASVSAETKMIDTNFFEVYKLKPVAGRLFDPRLDGENAIGPVVINAIAARQLGFATPSAAVGQTLLHPGEDGKLVPYRVLGIAPELRFRSLRDEPRATLYVLNTDWASVLSVRSTTAVRDAERAVAALWNRYFPDAIMHTERAGEVLGANYADDTRLARLLLLATLIALAITAFGMYALSGSIVQRRAREIVLRKLYGAGRARIAALLGRELGMLIAVAAVLGLPLAFIAIARYQAGFVEHAPLVQAMPWLALCGVALVTLLATLRHAWQALTMRPGRLLR